MADSAELKFQRGKQKSVLTRTLNFFKKLNNQIPDVKTKLELEIRLEKLVSAHNLFNEIQDKIEFLEGESESEVDEREEFESSSFGLQAEIQALLLSAKESQQSQNGETSSNNAKLSSNLENQSQEHQVLAVNPYVIPQVHLPSSKMPTYNGEYHKWVEFRDSFQALVDRNPIITDIQKLHYLRSCLSPSVLETIQSIPITAANYHLAWDTLKNRYEKSQLIRQSHVKAILNLPRLIKESARDLRKFYNEINNNLESLRNLNEPVDYWDLILIPIIIGKLDPISQKEWEKYSTIHNSATVKDLLTNLSTRCEVLEKLENDKNSLVKYSQRTNHLVHVSHLSSSPGCFMCKETHPIYYCKEFLNLNPKQRFELIKKQKRCINCLSLHLSSQCKSQFRCKKCGKMHNTLLHEELNQKRGEQVHESRVERKNISQTLSSTVTQELNSISSLNQCQTLLSTAIVIVYDAVGNPHECRALLDNGAMSNFVTKELQQKLGLRETPLECTVKGIGQATHFMSSSVTLNIHSKFNKFSRSINCLVMEKITSNIPCSSFSLKPMCLPKEIQLADPEFNISKPIDLLLGSSIFWEILQPSRNKLPNTNVILQDTRLGWILGGSLQFKQASHSTGSINCLSVNESLEEQLSKFWQIDQVPDQGSSIDLQDVGEQIFQKTIKREKDGKFIVTIPLKNNVNQLGNSQTLAKNKFYFLEKRLLKNHQRKKEYSKFINEYIALNHMTPISEPKDDEELAYYMSHHCVCREDSLTTKLRVVFNASMKTDSGLSFNDVQYTGPAIQNDLTVLLINFRIHPYVMTADISKMYRMIWLNPQHTKFHRIFWRENPTDNLQCYELKTVTYGTASAPFLAIRCLHQLALENQEKFPQASKVIKNNFYVDDLVCGAQSEEELIRLQKEVSKILLGAGFELRKWLTNKETLYDKFLINKTMECSVIVFGEKETNKTLGIAWNAKNDTINFVINPHEKLKAITKRNIFAELLSIFDPLGLLGPIIVVGKLIMQQLWKEKSGWDEPVSALLSEKWQCFKYNIPMLNSIKIPRHVILPNATRIELHGFGDASQKAYGAAVYLVSKDDSRVSTHLLCSRSRVAPLKQQSLPRLELCAAVLVAQLSIKLLKALEINIDQCYFWSDSTITLSWIKACPSKWKTFVANRVAEIQRLTQKEAWYHISSAENPADVLSRGCPVKELQGCDLWWHGPTWLSKSIYPIQDQESTPDEALIEKRNNVSNNVQVVEQDIISRFSDFGKLRKVIAYCFRFLDNCRTLKSQRKTGEIDVQEINRAVTVLIACEQQRYFPEEYKILKQNKTVKPNSPLFSLNPFFHSDNLIRVGGRIVYSFYSFDKKHPIILSKNSRLTKLIFEYFHKRHFHCGPTQLLAAVRERYWPISGKQLAKTIYQKCVICFKARPKNFECQMGNLPQARVTQSIPFTHVGVDYAGPFQIKDRLTRNAKIVKCYVCLFICFSTKALHLEVVSDLTTSCFLDALKRFISRRGKPSHIYSDNARTFLGADSELRDLYKFLTQNNKVINQQLIEEQIHWHFIPPRAPHFGGIWESGVKSVKHHMKRIMRDYKFTFEQITTILCQIESILNSRPLCPLSSSPENVEVLTPGHFLIFRPPMSIPISTDTQLDSVTPTRQFRTLQHIIHHFWSRWRKEYIAELQRRVKWKTNSDKTSQAIKPGDIVLVKEEPNTFLKWPLAKVEDIHPGPDGVVRVATIRMDNTLKKRPVIKLCPLPKE